ERGTAALHALFANLRAGAAFEVAFEQAFGGSLPGVEAAWRRDLEARSSALVLMRDGTILWVTMALLFLWAPGVKMREKRLQLAEDVGEEDEDAILAAWLALRREREEGEAPTLR